MMFWWFLDCALETRAAGERVFYTHSWHFAYNSVVQGEVLSLFVFVSLSRLFGTVFAVPLLRSISPHYSESFFGGN